LAYFTSSHNPLIPQMKISALYIQEHAYLKYGFQTINLGGKYLYDVQQVGKNIQISREANPQFIERFFDISGSTVGLENVSAIVGQNGVGKSTVLDIIRSSFIDNTHALPYVKCMLIIEKGEQLLFHSLDYSDVFFNEEKVEHIRRGKLQTIYYSPHLDFRFNPNFDEVDYFDISLDKYIELDLVDMEAMDKNEHGISFPVKQELLFKNSVRQILFLTSDLVRKDGRFDKIFDFPLHGTASLFFRGMITDDSPRNVPYILREPLNVLDKKIEDELNDWGKVRKIGKNNKTTNEVEVQRYILKRNLIKHLISLLFRHMDRSNDYLSSVKFDKEVFENALSGDAYSAFLAFLEAAAIPTPNGAEQPFKVDAIKSLFDKIYEVANKVDDEEEIKTNEMVCSPDDAIEILKLHKAVIYDISNYYNKQLSEDSKSLRDVNFLVPDFIYYSPADKKLSSGENALINLFSKLYSFLDVKLNPEMNPKEGIETFILLLDEADLGFHPVWKKKFVKAIIKTLPYFFETYKQKPSIQIIFTTHDPLTLSDLPRSNVICLENKDGLVVLLDSLKSLRTFGANITDLLADSFFVDDGLVGDFAKDKIQETIIWLKIDSKKEAEHYRTLIGIIDEPIVKRKLAEMYDRKMTSDLELSIVERQITELQKIKEKLNDKNTNK
jgi:predicted ATP-binding protein involved in virulence